jgi:hypothetical protein
MRAKGLLLKDFFAASGLAAHGFEINNLNPEI